MLPDDTSLTVVQDATVPHEHPAISNRNDFTERCDAILKGHFGLSFTDSDAHDQPASDKWE
jgi:hypothetical protein